MKKKLSLDELKVKSFVTAQENKFKETVRGGGDSYPCPYYTKEKFCGDTGFQKCNETEVAICEVYSDHCGLPD